MIRVELPGHLRTLAQVPGEVRLELESPVTLGAVLAAIEARFPVLKGAIRDHGTLKRRPFVRYYACEEDFSLKDLGTLLPQPVLDGTQPLIILGAVAGG